MKCTKVRHESEAKAKHHVRALRKDGFKCIPYKCENCKYWHVGSTARRL